MFLKKIVGFACLSLLSTGFAATNHQHSHAALNKSMLQAHDNEMLPKNCEIEIINRSYDSVNVYGTFDDGSLLTPFSIYRLDSAHYISTFFNGYCHPSMFLDIVSFSGYHVYTGYSLTNSTINIYPGLKNFAQAKISVK